MKKISSILFLLFFVSIVFAQDEGNLHSEKIVLTDGNKIL